MPDPRFFPAPAPTSAAEIARRFGLELRGNGETELTGVAPLHLAGKGDIAFVAAARHLDAARRSAAAAFIVTEALDDDLADRTRLVSPAPQRSFAEIARAFHPPRAGEGGVSEGAHVDPTASLAPDVHVAPAAVISARAEIGPGCEIGAGAVIGPGVVLGAACRIGANAVVSHAILGERVRVFAGAVIGQDGFGYVPGPAGLETIPQLGRVRIGDDVDVGANTTIDRGAGDDTVIGPGTKIDNLVQIGHNCRIGAHCVIVSQVGISGSVTVGDGVQIGGKVGIADHLEIGAGARIAAGSGVARSVKAGETVGGYPAVPVRDWHRQVATLARLIRRKDG